MRHQHRFVENGRNFSLGISEILIEQMPNRRGNTRILKKCRDNPSIQEGKQDTPKKLPTNKLPVPHI